MERLACLIVGRNLGDAAIQSAFLRRLAERGYAAHYLVWTRPQVAFLFEDVPACEVVKSQFPVGTTKQFGGRAVLEFLRAAQTIRRLQPSITLDLIGDLRERLFARLTGSSRHLHIGWAPTHPFARLIRNPLGTGKPFITVPANVPNVYAAYDLMLDQLLPPKAADRALSHGPTAKNSGVGRTLRVGLHPFASQECKLWPAENWRELARRLLAEGAELTAFGAPGERGSLMELFDAVGESVALVTDSIPNFANAVAGLDVLVGLDSFSVHMAEKQGVRTVTINAGNAPLLWAPPGGRTLSNSGGCSAYPCFNVPMCQNTDRKYACVKAISVNEALHAALI